ncbi:transcription factor FapR [Oxobacter pfennigii]|uniref:Transcription factor FapR n=2 Tax=Oxobacter pfennigii TaxID=36849 RepID=A0A0P8YW65_9CLOT|nr:transcription factor FapR [Oxobacter pfennigii]
MVNKRPTKKDRQKNLVDALNSDPFLTDDELAEKFDISVQTIRLDRMELKIPELRERVKNVAENNFLKVKSIRGQEFVGELIDIQPGKSAISILDTSKDMVFENSQVVKGQHIYAQAESIALAIIDAHSALTGVANIKYKRPVLAGEKLVAKAEVIRQRGNRFFVWVMIYIKQQEVFRGKFVLVSMDDQEGI